jgi:predicted ATPase
VCSAETGLDTLFVADDKPSSFDRFIKTASTDVKQRDEEAFAFQRSLSRLKQMQSREWLGAVDGATTNRI